MVVEKNGVIQEIEDRVPIIRAYMQSGWTEVKKIDERKSSSTKKKKEVK